jgi:predicted nucleic acid-binding Zn ribbon protein
MAFCTECGANVPEDLKFCTECGAAMGAANGIGSAAPAPITAPPVAEATRQTAPTPQQQQRQPPPESVQPAYYPPPSQPAYGFDAPPPKGSKYAVIGTGGYIGLMILFAIPAIGWLACVITAFAAKNRNRRSFARATLVFLIIGLVIAVALYFVFSWAWEVVREYIQQYISDATGGQITDFDGLNNFFDIFKGLAGLDIPVMPGQ